jgi:UDP-GlcNAc:undecaprenyl-phosphate GlcNAc-1-phosphate transferase
MSAVTLNILSFVLPFFICVTMIIALRTVAVKIGLLDRPCERKQHEGLVPLVGGIAIFTAFSISAVLLSPSWSTVVMVLIALGVGVLGVLDDIHGLQTRKRFLVQIMAAVAMVYLGGVQITQLGNLFGDGVIRFGALMALLFSVFSAVGVINAMNMVDGADGLAGSIAFLTFLALAYVAYSAGDFVSTEILLIMVGAISAFILFNARLVIPKAQIFMGDAGSMFIGFVMAWYFIVLSQGDEPALSAVSAGWLFGLPLLDISAVMTRRLMEGRSPFAAGRDHIHHLLIDRGYSVNKALLIIVVAHAFFISIGLLSNVRRDLEPALFWLFIVLVATHIVVTHKFLIPKEAALLKATPKTDKVAATEKIINQKHSVLVDASNQKSNHS